MNYKEALKFTENANIYGSVLGLENMQILMRCLHNIQNNLKYIHIAGTNGKGSVGTFIENILNCSGFKTGRYVSPAVFSYTEIFRINCKPISEEDFAAAAEKVKNAVIFAENEFKIHPTKFEIETAIAFILFYEQKCDFIILETGLGGRLDATNIIKDNILSIITSISYDHNQFLGNTLSEIALEKCGIIKKNGYVVTSEQKTDVANVIKTVCKERNCNINIVKKDDIGYNGFFEGYQHFSYKNLKNLKISLLGKFQIENAAVATESAKILRNNGINIPDSAIYAGLESAKWSGRFEIIGQKPTFIIDGAHNDDAALKLRESIISYFGDKRKIFIIGIFKDKEYEKIIRNTVDIADAVYTVTIDGNRALDGKIIEQTVKRYNKCVEYKNDFKSAVEAAQAAAEKDGVVICFGSLSYLGKITDIVKNKGGNL